MRTIKQIEQYQDGMRTAIQRLREKILGLALCGKLVAQDPNDEPAIELLKRINSKFIPCDNSHYGNIPESWCVTKLGEVYNHTTGKALKKSNTVGVLREYLTTSNVYWNSFDFTEVRSMYFSNDELEKCTVQKGDLLICNGGDVGRAAIWNYDYNICIQNHISRLRSKHIDVVDNLFYCYVFSYLKQKGKLNGKGVAITSLSAIDILSIPIPLPPIQEQKRIVKRLSEIFSNINEIIAEL